MHNKIVILLLFVVSIPIAIAIPSKNIENTAITQVSYEIDKDAVTKCQGGFTLEFLNCYKRLTGFEYPQYVELSYGNYLLERCSPDAYAISYESIICMLRHKQIYFEYHNLTKENEQELVLSEIKFIKLQKDTCFKKGNQFRFFCANYDTYLMELYKYQNLPGYFGVGLGLPDLNKVDKGKLEKYFGFNSIISIKKESENTYLIEAQIERKFLGLFNKIVNIKIKYNLKQLNQETIKEWWFFFYKDL